MTNELIIKRAKLTLIKDDCVVALVRVQNITSYGKI